MRNTHLLCCQIRSEIRGRAKINENDMQRGIQQVYPTLLGCWCWSYHGQFPLSSGSTVSMAIWHHEIYCKSRRAVNSAMTEWQVGDHKNKRNFKVCSSFSPFCSFRWSSATCQADPPACQRTAELLRGEHHIRRSESSSLPAVNRTVNLIINQPPTPPLMPDLFVLYVGVFATPLYAKTTKSLLIFVFIIYFSSFHSHLGRGKLVCDVLTGECRHHVTMT